MNKELCGICGISAVDEKCTQPFGFENSEGKDCLAEEQKCKVFVRVFNSFK
jgi:hypothetical protein